MPVKEPPLTIGIEEEYLLVDRKTRDLAVDPTPDMIEQCAALLTGQVSTEFLRA
jgi:carboxylate-amine ligase